MKKKRLLRSDKLWLAAVALLILLQFWWLPGDPGTPDDSYSNTVEGKRGFFQTLDGLAQAELLPPVRRESEQLIPNEPCTLVIVSPDRYPNEHEQHDLARFVLHGGSLVFAPNWTDAECSIPQLSIQTVPESFYEESIPVALPASAGPGNGNVTPSVPEQDTNQAGELTAEAEDEEASSQVAKTIDTTIVVEGLDENEDGETKDRSVVERAIREQATVPAAAGSGSDEILSDIANIKAGSTLVSDPILWRTRAAMETYNMNPTVLVRSSGGTVQAASWSYGTGKVVLSASPDIFSNGSMLDPVRAELAVRLVEHAHQGLRSGLLNPPIVVSEYLNASDKYQGTSVLISPSLRSGTLQLILVAVLAGWFGFSPLWPGQENSDTSAAKPDRKRDSCRKSSFPHRQRCRSGTFVS